MLHWYINLFLNNVFFFTLSKDTIFILSKDTIFPVLKNKSSYFFNIHLILFLLITSWSARRCPWNYKRISKEKNLIFDFDGFPQKKHSKFAVVWLAIANIYIDLFIYMFAIAGQITIPNWLKFV